MAGLKPIGLHQALVLLTAVFSLTSSVPICAEDTGAQMCLVSSNADIFLLPEAAEIHIGLPEDNTVDLGNGVFPALNTLRTLQIDLLHIDNIKDDAFINLVNLTKLVFENSDMYRPHKAKTVSANAFRGLGKLKELTASDTGLKNINQVALNPLVSLTSLDFSDNLLSSVPPSLFERTVSLTSLNLRKNQLTSLPQGLLSPLRELVSLDLSNNFINNITDGTFSDNSKLLQLSLDNNLLTTLSPSIISGLTNIVSIRLNDNRITSVDVDTFSSANKLESLDLSSNMIESLPDNTFSALPQVEFLELFNNKLKVISSNTLSGLSNLKYFDAYNNQIEAIEDRAFRHSPHLVSLHLQYNRISDISTSAFAGLNQLSALTLYNNSLAGLSKVVFGNLDKLNLLDISANPWVCDCALFWMQAWFESADSSMKLENAATTKCAGSDQLVTVYLLNAAAQCAPTTLAPPMAESTAAVVPNVPKVPSTPQETTMSVIVIDGSTGLHDKVTMMGPVSSVSAKELSDAELGGIIAACLFGALFIIILIVLFLYCRHKRYFFWRPEKVSKTHSLHLKERQETERIVREQLRLAAQQPSHRYYDPEIGHNGWNDPRGMVYVVDNGVIVNGHYTVANDRPTNSHSIYTLPNSAPFMISTPSAPPPPSANSSVSRATTDSGFMISPPLPPANRSGFSNMAFEDSGGEMSPVSAVRHFQPSVSGHSTLPGLHHTTPLTESVVLGMLSPSTPTGPSGYLYPVNSKAREHQYATIDGAYNEHPYNTINDNDVQTLPVRPGNHSPNHTYQELQSSFDPRNYMIKPENESTPISDSKDHDFDQDTIAKPPLDFDDDSTLGHKDTFDESMNSQCASLSSSSTYEDNGAVGEATSPPGGYKKRKPVPKPRKLRKGAAKNTVDEEYPPVFDDKQ